jgi:HPt (histidine-containing phosphotransfer) domain-containing protein
MSEQPEYDSTLLEQLTARIGKDGMTAVLQAVIDDAPQLMRGLSESLDKGDEKAVRLYAHTMKSNGRIVGAGKLCELCGEVEETAASGGPLAGIRPQAAAALERFERLVRDLSACLES